MSYVIEEGIPVSKRYGPRTPVTMALEALEPEQSFVITNDTEYIQVRGRLSKLKPKKFRMRKLGRDGWRIWRVE